VHVEIEEDPQMIIREEKAQRSTSEAIAAAMSPAPAKVVTHESVTAAKEQSKPVSEERIYQKETAKVVQYLEQEHYQAKSGLSLADVLA
jgi:hypothetical protein